MEKGAIHLNDIQRILFGQAPPTFLVEVFFRTLLIYLFLLFTIRWLGKRMSGQLTIMEMAVMLTLGAIIAVPMQMPDKGLLQGVVLLLCAVGFLRGLGFINFQSGKIEDLTQGKTSLLVKNGMLQLDQMEKDSITRQQVYANLREKKIFNLGMVERVYLEAHGIFSIFQYEKPQPGLSILPPDDVEFFDAREQMVSERSVPFIACNSCGFVKEKDGEVPCANCGNNQWVKATRQSI